ncbi:MAG: DUF547 domain-containing protein [Planctomycetota bacterium]
MSTANHYGKAGWIAAIIVSVVVTFVGTLLFAQSVWSHNQGPTAGAKPTTNPATQPATQPGAGSAEATAMMGGPNDTLVSTAAGKIAGVGSFDGTMDVDHSAFHDLLQAHVDNERVDYAALNGGAERQKFDAYLDMMSKVDIDALSEAERLAYWINLYNASMIEAVLLEYPVDHVENDLGFGVFKKQFIETTKGTMSLDDIEHATIREQWDEPRIHAALVCGAISCPPLADTAFTAENVDALLEKNFTQWINGARNEFDHAGKRAKLSSIFSWYGVDFGDSNADTLAYINKYLDQDITGYSVEFLDYDWSLNTQ